MLRTTRQWIKYALFVERMFLLLLWQLILLAIKAVLTAAMRRLAVVLQNNEVFFGNY
jgi:hypothetical protein